jgi:hypothetical protein
MPSPSVSASVDKADDIDGDASTVDAEATSPGMSVVPFVVIGTLLALAILALLLQRHSRAARCRSAVAKAGPDAAEDAWTSRRSSAMSVSTGAGGASPYARGRQPSIVEVEIDPEMAARARRLSRGRLSISGRRASMKRKELEDDKEEKRLQDELDDMNVLVSL